MCSSSRCAAPPVVASRPASPTAPPPPPLCSLPRDALTLASRPQPPSPARRNARDDERQRVSEAETTYYAKLREHVEQIELLTDELFQMDVQHIADNDHYFPFEELLNNIVLAFSRDPWLLQNSHVRTHKPLIGHACAAQPTGTAIPPCGVQPFRGFVNYAAPLTFLFEAEEPAYFVLRAMYAKLWCHLNVMRSQPDTLLPLCKLFEELVQVRSHSTRLVSLSHRITSRYHRIGSRHGRIAPCNMRRAMNDSMDRIHTAPTHSPSWGFRAKPRANRVRLAQRHQPQLFFHMLQIGVTPLQIALPWIQFGFVGYLEVRHYLR